MYFFTSTFLETPGIYHVYCGLTVDADVSEREEEGDGVGEHEGHGAGGVHQGQREYED